MKIFHVIERLFKYGGANVAYVSGLIPFSD